MPIGAFRCRSSPHTSHTCLGDVQESVGNATLTPPGYANPCVSPSFSYKAVQHFAACYDERRTCFWRWNSSGEKLHGPETSPKLESSGVAGQQTPTKSILRLVPLRSRFIFGVRKPENRLSTALRTVSEAAKPKAVNVNQIGENTTESPKTQKAIRAAVL